MTEPVKVIAPIAAPSASSISAWPWIWPIAPMPKESGA